MEEVHSHKNTRKKTAINAIIICIVALFILFFAALAGFFDIQKSGLFSITDQSENEPVTRTTSSTSENFSGINRLDYNLPIEVFIDLPKIPNDFNKTVDLMHQNIFTNYDFFSRDYYLQPEFYPSFIQNGLIYWQNPDPKYYGVGGIGFFPATQLIKIKKGEKKNASFFVHSGFGVRQYQGVRLELEQSNNDKQKSFNEGIFIELINPDFLLGPNYPTFSDTWVVKANLKIIVSENANSGEHDFVFKVKKPLPQNSLNWYNFSKGKYYEIFDSGVDIFKTITVKVV